MINIAQNLKDICRKRGLTLTDVANRMGTSPSNLLSSVKGNPTIARLHSIAEALQVSVTELVSRRPEIGEGLVIINGQTYQLSLPTQTTVQLPVYSRYDALRKKITDFVKSAVRTTGTIAIMGIIETAVAFSLQYDSYDAKFHLALCHSEGKTKAFSYSKHEYADWDKPQSDDDPAWNLLDVIDEIIGDIEEVVLVR